MTSTTADGAQTVVDHYEQVFQDAGYTIGARSLTQTGDAAFGAISGEQGGRSINVAVIGSAEGSQITVNYNERS